MINKIDEFPAETPDAINCRSPLNIHKSSLRTSDDLIMLAHIQLLVKKQSTFAP